MLGPFLRPAARLALAGIFVRSGYQVAVNPGERPKVAERLGVPQPEIAVRANGAAMVLGGTALALGVRPRLSALALIASLAATTYAGHPFWLEQTPEGRQRQELQFLKNLGLIGGLLMVIAEPSRSSRRRRRRHERKAARKAARKATEAASSS